MGAKALILTLVAATLGWDVPPQPPPPTASPRPPSPESLQAVCGLLARCGLATPVGCTPQAALGVPGVTYDDARCREARALAARGLTPATDLGFRLYRFLGRRYRIVYPLDGRLAISDARLSFLLADLPFAARLLSHYQKEAYSAEYLDRERVRFRARRGDGLSGEGELVAGGPAERIAWYLGTGTSRLGPWRLRGQGLVEVQYWPDGGGLAYRLRVIATPANAVINAFMGMSLFRSVVLGRVREIMKDIAEASGKLDQAGGSVSGEWSSQDREKIEALARLP